MTPSYSHLDAESSKESFPVVSRRNSARFDNGAVLSPTSETSAEAFFERHAGALANCYQSGSYAQRRSLVREIIGEELLRRNRPVTTIRLLDFGCGSGILLKDAADLGLQATGVDSCKGMILAARDQLAGLRKQVSLEWLRSSSAKGNYERESYDIVLCLSVLEFLHDMRSALSRICARVMRGGILVLSVPNRHSLLRSLEGFIYRNPRAFHCFPRLHHLTGADSYLNYQVHQFTRAELSGFLHEYGLREEQHRFHVAPPLLHCLGRFEPIGMMLMAVFRRV